MHFHAITGAMAICLAAFCHAACSPSASAQAWVAKLFEEQSHDFGTVAKGSDTVYRFAVKNRFREEMRLVSVRTSCGCTTPSIENGVLETHEIGYVVASFNTRTFSGPHGATLTVQVEWTDANGGTHRTEQQLRVDGIIRDDIVFQPGSVRFESVDQGVAAEQRLQVTYSGRSDWRITDVRSEFDGLQVEMNDVSRSPGRVVIDLRVRLKDTAPPGYLSQRLVLVTNDARNPRIPIEVEGRVIPQVSVSPETLVFGEVRAGTTVTKRIMVRGKRPFRIVSVQCNDDCFRIEAPEGSSDRHLIDVVFTPSETAGTVRQAIRFETDLGEQYVTTCTAYATVLPGATSQQASPAQVDRASTQQSSAVGSTGSAAALAARN